MSKTQQEIFNDVVRHARTMKEKAVNECDMCRYRAPNGEKCFVGQGVPDEEYDSAMENKSVYTLFDDYSFMEKNFGKENKHFLSELQDIHDLYEMEQWGVEFRKVAERYELTLPEEGGTHVRR